MKASEVLRNYLRKRVEAYWPDKRLVYRAVSRERAAVLLVVLEEIERLKREGKAPGRG